MRACVYVCVCRIRLFLEKSLCECLCGHIRVGTYMYMYRVKMKTSSVYGKECRHTICLWMDCIMCVCVCVHVCGAQKHLFIYAYVLACVWLCVSCTGQL